MDTIKKYRITSSEKHHQDHYRNQCLIPPPIVDCAKCGDQFDDFELMAYTGNDEYLHLRCFVCAQCFRPFDENEEYHEFAGRKYCRRDYVTLFAPFCIKCHQDITNGAFVRLKGKCFHHGCYKLK